jgi:hypothetical protein
MELRLTRQVFLEVGPVTGRSIVDPRVPAGAYDEFVTTAGAGSRR